MRQNVRNGHKISDRQRRPSNVPACRWHASSGVEFFRMGPSSGEAWDGIFDWCRNVMGKTRVSHSEFHFLDVEDDLSRLLFEMWWEVSGFGEMRCCGRKNGLIKMCDFISFIGVIGCFAGLIPSCYPAKKVLLKLGIIPFFKLSEMTLYTNTFCCYSC